MLLSQRRTTGAINVVVKDTGDTNIVTEHMKAIVPIAMQVAILVDIVHNIMDLENGRVRVKLQIRLKNFSNINHVC